MSSSQRHHDFCVVQPVTQMILTDHVPGRDEIPGARAVHIGRIAAGGVAERRDGVTRGRLMQVPLGSSATAAEVRRDLVDAPPVARSPAALMIEGVLVARSRRAALSAPAKGLGRPGSLVG